MKTAARKSAVLMQMFHFLHYGFASIITILGIKMLLSDVYKAPLEISLVLIVFILLISMIVSLLRPRKADLKMLFERTERLGLIPFRRLLLIENIIDLGDLSVRDAMRSRGGVRVVRLDATWAENLRMISDTHFSRYPLVEREGDKPIGAIHVKNIPFADPPEHMTADRLRGLARPGLEMQEDLPLDDALVWFQQRYDRLALVVNDAGEWTGILTFEDVLEEIVGSMGDEFDLARAGQLVSLADALSPGRVLFELRAKSMRDAIQQIIARIPRAELRPTRRRSAVSCCNVNRPCQPTSEAVWPYHMGVWMESSDRCWLSRAAMQACRWKPRMSAPS